MKVAASRAQASSSGCSIAPRSGLVAVSLACFQGRGEGGLQEKEVCRRRREPAKKKTILLSPHHLAGRAQSFIYSTSETAKDDIRSTQPLRSHFFLAHRCTHLAHTRAGRTCDRESRRRSTEEEQQQPQQTEWQAEVSSRALRTSPSG